MGRMQVWNKERWDFVSVRQDAAEWKEGPHPTGTGTCWYHAKMKRYQDDVPEAVRAVAAGASAVHGPYDAMDSGDALAVRNLIEQHRDKMLTIRRRDFEVGKKAPVVIQSFIFAV